MNKKPQLRAYTPKGEKVFLDFDIKKFNRVMKSGDKFGNALLEQALSAATNNIDEMGNHHDYLRIEWLERDHKTGLTK